MADWAHPLVEVESTLAAPGARTGADDAMWGRLLLSYLRSVGRRARLRCRGGDGRDLLAAEVAARITEVGEDGRAALLTYWVADSLAVSLLPFADAVLANALAHVEFLVDETFGGRVTAAMIRRAGGATRVLALPGDPRRLHALRDVMRHPRAYGFAVDGGGPYGEVGTGIVGLAGTLGSAILPLAIRAHPAIGLGHRSRVSLPLPGCRLDLAIGMPVSVERHADRRAAAKRVGDELSALGAVMRGRAA